MLGYLKRLVTTGAAYQFGDIVAKALALLTLPLYTHHLSPQAYGAAESLLTAVILCSILLRVGVGEAFIRFYFDDDDRGRRERIARTATATVAWTTTAAALVALALAGPLSEALLSFRDPLLLDCAVLGLWAFTNLEMAYAQLRVDERARTYVLASGANVAMTVVFTVALVVFARQGARGLLLGNFGASAVVVLGLWWTLRRRISLRVRLADLGAMLRFGLPTVPADASVYALQVADRFYLFRSYSHSAAGLYAIAIKLATVVFVAVRGFQYAWPPLAYSIEEDEEAGRLYALVTTYYALATGIVVCGVALLGRWMVRLLAAHRYFDAHRALPWLALGWALYGLYLVFLAIAGRARVTSRNLPAAAAGLGVNVALLVLLVPASGAGLGIAGAGIALCGAYAAMLAVMYLLTRGLFRVGFESRRLVQLVAVFA
ncbi:MAG: lipopolysaccharide biosynthesis protein, partial [Solirubrobacteraceae bacterium]